jgi:hypothetical protein
MSRIRESDLYLPVKRLLEGQGYTVKGEVGAADVVALREGEDEPVIVELKAGFSLSLFHQAIERQALTDAVYVAVPRGSGRASLKALVENRKLCRRLGLGLITVKLADGFVEVHCDPEPYRPRQSKLVGDPNTGGTTRRNIVTAYRQEALLCLRLLGAEGPTKASTVAKGTGVAHARRLMADNHYGWFERGSTTGVYGLSPKGAAAIVDYAAEIDRIAAARPDADLPHSGTTS